MECKVNETTNFFVCTSNSKKSMESLKGKNLILSLSRTAVMIPLAHLIRDEEEKGHSNILTLNIKQTYNNYAVLGEPLFRHYYMLFDYGKNRVGFSGRR